MPERFFNLLGSIVTVALVATVVSSPRTAGIITSLGNAFRGAINAAQRA
jgi:hypothetical protein